MPSDQPPTREVVVFTIGHRDWWWTDHCYDGTSHADCRRGERHAFIEHRVSSAVTDDPDPRFYEIWLWEGDDSGTAARLAGNQCGARSPVLAMRLANRWLAGEAIDFEAEGH